MGLSIAQLIFYGLVPLGQLYVRVFILNGSLDHSWSLYPLFLFPPLSFIPLLLMYFGVIKKGKGSSPYDNWVWIPVMVKFIIPFILPSLLGNKASLYGIISTLVLLLTTYAINIKRHFDNCKEGTVGTFGKALIDSVTEVGLANVIPKVITYIPLIGTAISILKMMPVIGGIITELLWVIGFIGMYIIMNMFNQDDMSKYCNVPFYGFSSDVIPFILGLAMIYFGMPSPPMSMLMSKKSRNDDDD